MMIGQLFFAAMAVVASAEDSSQDAPFEQWYNEEFLNDANLVSRRTPPRENDWEPRQLNKFTAMLREHDDENFQKSVQMGPPPRSSARPNPDFKIVEYRDRPENVVHGVKQDGRKTVAWYAFKESYLDRDAQYSKKFRYSGLKPLYNNLQKQIKKACSKYRKLQLEKLKEDLPNGECQDSHYAGVARGCPFKPLSDYPGSTMRWKKPYDPARMKRRSVKFQKIYEDFKKLKTQFDEGSCREFSSLTSAISDFSRAVSVGPNN